LVELRGFWYLQRNQRRLWENKSFNLTEKKQEKTKNKIIISSKNYKSIVGFAFDFFYYFSIISWKFAEINWNFAKINWKKVSNGLRS